MAGSTYNELPHKYEAGYPPIAPVVGLGAAVEYLTGSGMDNVAAHEQHVTAYALERLQQIDGLRVVGPGEPIDRGGAVSFVLDGSIPTTSGRCSTPAAIAVRVGQHCAWPVCRPDGCSRDGTRVVLRLLHHRRGGPARGGPDLVRSFFGGGGLMDVAGLYQEIILDHYRNPHHKGLREPFDAEVHHVNPTCGDEVTVRVHVVDGTVQDVSYEGMGCSISQAATSVMTDLVIGRTVDEALAV